MHASDSTPSASVQGRPALAVPVVAAASFVVLAALSTLALFGHTVEYGFHYDDYVLVRPHAADEVLASFRGNWDTTGVMVPFYRPLTVAFHAARFTAFGLDARPHHALSLALFAACGVLAGWLAFRLTGRPALGAFGTVLFAAHPAMPYSLVAWITNQMHLLSTLTVLAAFAWWHAVRGKPFVWWVPLLALGAIAFLLKEDGVMLLPAVLVAHGLVRRIGPPGTPAAPRAFVLAALTLVVALLVVRTLALDGLGGYGRPTVERGWVNYWDGLQKLLRLVPADRPWQPLASGFATLLPIAALLAWRRSSPGPRACLAIGAAMALLFNLPFALVTKGEQMHLVATGAVLLLTGAAGILFDAGRRIHRPLIAAALSAGVLACAAVARDISADFDPFGPIVLANDAIVQGWTAVPAQVHDYLSRKRAAGRGRISANPVDELSYVIFGAHGRETGPDGLPYQWMARTRADIVVFRQARLIEIPLRHEIGAFRQPTSALVDLGARPADRLLLDTGAWRVSTFGLWSSAPPYSIRITIPQVWYPSRIIPGSNDPRALGLQIGDIALR
jgi:hypothetical protein